ncbi:GNAT family N-acetyltransferase [Pararhodobacter aggregans]|uniref:N-acetyltransferase n=1 Tax=Pararhodobacter aggregans TaxID=404875 RepID=A0A2T7UT51_9RHOB|nr:GNAT family N-acetyltransferase [Pararhodobacter aggregans]PTX02691.1 RimJ/RimL family protein N-acetyltransferase [Pararhodobacter aggregans]PVE47923.1 N-acetyltransferase [Pararhodobacter aggregans]
MIAPVLTTDRLILRQPQLSDFEHWAEFFATGRSVHEGGPLDRAGAYRVWASDAALWLLRGYGPFAVEDRETGAYLGDVGIYQPEGFPETELGWFVVPEAEGRGIAAEAARAVMGWARARFGWEHLVNIIDPRNTRSLALGLRLGGVIDPARPGVDPGDVVILHDLRRAA